MISRVWRGWTPPEHADAYEALLLTKMLPGIREKLPEGYHGAYLFRRNTDDGVEFMTTLFFDSIETVAAFAGPDFEVAVIHPEATGLLSRYEPRSAHFEVRRTPADDRRDPTLP
jgi:hypothetical protein